MGELTKADRMEIELWTAEDMLFVIDKKRGIEKIPRHTPCVKPPYTKRIKRYIENMEEKRLHRPEGNPKGVCVKLEGTLRYVWRTQVLTKEEYDAVRSKKRNSLGALRSKSRRPLGEGTKDTD